MTDKFSPAQETGPASSQIVCASLKKPVTPLELITNIKAAIDRDFFRREAFFDEENLKHFAGAGSVEWDRRPEHALERAVLSNFGTLVEPVLCGGNIFPGIDLSVDKPRQGGRAEGKPLLRLNITQSIAELRFENIEDIFGKEWKRYVLSYPIPSRRYKNPTATMGNQTIDYRLEVGDHSDRILIEFHFDGTLGRLAINGIRDAQ